MGYDHPDELLSNLSAKQITEWECFNRIQPIGLKRWDVYYSTLMTALHNIALGFSGSKTAEKFKVEDFVPNWMGTTDTPEEMSAEKQKQFWIAFAESHNKRIDEDNQKSITKRVRR